MTFMAALSCCQGRVLLQPRPTVPRTSQDGALACTGDDSDELACRDRLNDGIDCHPGHGHPTQVGASTPVRPSGANHVRTRLTALRVQHPRPSDHRPHAWIHPDSLVRFHMRNPERPRRVLLVGKPRWRRTERDRHTGATQHFGKTDACLLHLCGQGRSALSPRRRSASRGRATSPPRPRSLRLSRDARCTPDADGAQASSATARREYR